MRLYLVQHAEAKSKEEDPSRPLSVKGWNTIRKVAQFAEQYLSIEVEEIVHSGKLRASQTGAELAEHLKPAKGLTISADLEPLADPMIWKDRLSNTTHDIMLVGHLPHLSRLSGLLLTKNADQAIIEFRMGGVVCLRGEESDRWTVEWIVPPEIIS